MAKPIGHNFFVGPHLTQGKVYGCSELQKLSPYFLILVKILKVHKEKMLKDWETIKSTFKIEDA